MITLYTFGTPNGKKPVILLEELQLPYILHKIDISNDDQFTPEFKAINPNSKIPAIVDTETDITVFESGAILTYLAEKTNSELFPSPANAKKRNAVMQWLMFQMAGVGPMFGQFNHFTKYAPEKVPYAIERYKKEVMRLLAVCDTQLEKKPFLAGDEYSIADIASYSWFALAGNDIDLASLFPNVHKWVSKLAERPAVKTGMAVFTENFDSKFGTLA